jgi:hypothetical protein
MPPNAEPSFLQNVISVINEVFGKIAPRESGYRVLELKVYSEDVVQALSGDNDTQFKELSLQEKLEPGPIRLELVF